MGQSVAQEATSILEQANRIIKEQRKLIDEKEQLEAVFKKATALDRQYINDLQSLNKGLLKFIEAQADCMSSISDGLTEMLKATVADGNVDEILVAHRALVIVNNEMRKLLSQKEM